MMLWGGSRKVSGNRKSAFRNGDPGGSRTPNPQIRSLMLYPIELRGRPPVVTSAHRRSRFYTAVRPESSLAYGNLPGVVTSKRMSFAANLVPNPVTHTSSRLLEFETLRELLAGYSSSPLGQRRIAELLPSLNRAWIETQQQLTTEIREYRRVGGRFEFAGLPEVKKLIEKSRIAGAALETGEIRDVVLIADRAAEWREIVRQPPAAMRCDWGAVAALSNSIQDFTGFLRAFHNKILPDGTLDDRASPELSRIRREIEKQKRQIQDSLRGYLRKL